MPSLRPWRGRGLTVASALPSILGLWRGVAAVGAGSGGAGAGTPLQCRVQEEDDAGQVAILDCGGILFERIGIARLITREADELEPYTSEWYSVICQALGCIICAAIAAGLTLGLTSIDEFALHIILQTQPDDIRPNASPTTREAEIRQLTIEQGYANRILPLVSRHFFGCKGRVDAQGHHHPNCLDPTNNHYLLVTLLLLNATANEALPLFFDRLMPAWLAILMSVSVVLVFGEIIPSAIFTGRNQLKLAAGFSPLVNCAEVLFFPIVWPISLILDKALGHAEKMGYSKAQMKGLVRALKKHECDINLDEMNMIHGVLEMHNKTAWDVAHIMQEAKSLSNEDVITDARMKVLIGWGHSRCFVHRGNDPSDIVGVLMVKSLLDPDLKSNMRCGDLKLKRPIILKTGENLLDTLNKFQEGHCHLAIISDDPDAIWEAWDKGLPIPEAARPTAFCSLEDVIEEMLAEEIYDEGDMEQMAKDSPGLRSPSVASSSRGSMGLKVTRACSLVQLGQRRPRPKKTKAKDNLLSPLLSEA